MLDFFRDSSQPDANLTSHYGHDRNDHHINDEGHFRRYSAQCVEAADNLSVQWRCSRDYQTIQRKKRKLST